MTINEKWIQWSKEVLKLKGLKILRYILNLVIEQRRVLFIFSDASVNSYGVAAHVKLKVEDTFVTNIVASSKSRVASLNKFILPKLESMDAFLTATSASKVKKRHRQEATIYEFFLV